MNDWDLMTNHRDETARSGGSGRKTALLLVGIAFVASVTTAMLAFTTSHHAREADAKALPADAADLHRALDLWQADLPRPEHTSREELAPYIDRLTGQAASLANWKARTPCGEDARDHLHEAMEARLRRLTRIKAGQEAGIPPADEASVLDTALATCASGQGGDVNI